jgi:hypothetical protein
MSGINPKRSYEGDSLPLTHRARVDSNDLLSQLEQRFHELSPSQSDYDLVKQVDRLYREHQYESFEQPTVFRLFSANQSRFTHTPATRVTSLYNQTLRHHRLTPQDLKDPSSALMLAIENKNIARIDYLLQIGFCGNDSEFVSSTVRNFMESKDIEKVVTLVSSDFISNSIKKSIIYELAQNEPRPTVITLLNHQIVSVADLFNLAILAGNTDMVRKMLDLKPAECFGSLVQQALQAGNIEIAKLLLSHAAQLTKEWRGILMVEVARRGDEEMVKMILNSGDMCPSTVNYALKAAAAGGYKEIVEDLLKSKTFSPQARAEAISVAALNQHYAAVELLINSSPFCSISLRLALDKLIETRQLDMLQRILRATNANPNDFENAVYSAMHHRCFEIIDFLSSSCHINESLRYRVLIYALENDQPDLAERILGSGPFFSSNRSQALVLAARRGYFDLLNNPQFLREMTLCERGAVLLSITRNGPAAMIDPLFESGDVHPHQFAAAVHAAAEESRAEVLRLLLPEKDEDYIAELIRKMRILTIPNTEDLKANSLHYLEDIADRGFPSQMRFANSRAIDEGGVSKQCVSILLESLESKLKLPASRIPLISPEELTTKNLYKTLGAFFSSVHEKNASRADDPILIGLIFAPEFFEILKIALEPTLSQEQKMSAVVELISRIDPSQREPLDRTSALIHHPQDQQSKEAFAAMFGCEETEALEIARELLQQYLTPAECFLERCSDELKTMIRARTHEQLSLLFQGQEATVEALQAAILIEGEETSVFAEQIGWLREAINNSDFAWRKAFIEWATANKTLVPSLRIVLESTSTQGIAAHTCFNHIELPKEITEKEAFLMSLNHQLEGFDFNIA